MAPPTLPARKLGGKDMAYAFEGNAATAIKAEIEAELVDLKAFREFLPEGGEYRLEVDVTEARREFRDLRGEGETPSTLLVEIDGKARWFRGTEVVHETTLDLSRKLSMDDAPGRRDLQRAYREIFREAGQRAFADLYEARFFKSIGGVGDGGR